MKKQYIQVNAKVKELGENKLEAIVSTNSLDRHGEVVDIQGIEIDNYLKNPVVLWAHDYSLPPIAKTLELKKEKIKGKSVLRAVMEFATDISELAKEVFELYKGGFMNAFSIGFIPLEEEGNVYTASELLEYSAVPIPANPEALLLAKAKGLDTTLFTKYHNNMEELNKILQKEVGDLTIKEVEILKSHVSDLTDEQKAKYATVLGESDLAKEISEVFETKMASLKEELIKELDTPKVKDINTKEKDINITVDTKQELSKEELFKMYVVGLSQGDMSKYKAAMNTSDDSALLPPGDFVAEVERLTSEYGVAIKYANVRMSNKAKLTLLLGNDEVELFETDEAGVKLSTSMTYSPVEILWRKMAGVLPVTDELEEESAIDLWNDATQSFARAFAKKQDNIVFNEPTTTGKKYAGVLHVTGTKTVNLSGSSVSSLTTQNLLDMIYGVPESAGNKFWLNRDVLAKIAGLTDLQGKPLLQPALSEEIPATILGKPYVLVEVMPQDGANKPVFAYGDLRYVTLGIRKGLKIEVFNTGVVTDPDDSDKTLNLLTQDMKAMRAVGRLNARVRFPKAFAVAKTAAATS